MAVTPRKTLKNLIDSDVYGDITLFNPKFENDDNVITKKFLKERLDELIELLDQELPEKVTELIKDDISVSKSFKDSLILYLLKDEDVIDAFKTTLDLCDENDLNKKVAYLINNDRYVSDELKFKFLYLLDDKDISNKLRDKLIDLLNNDDEIKGIFKSSLLPLLLNDDDIKSTLKSTILSFILSDTDIQNAIKLLFAWIFKIK